MGSSGWRDDGGQSPTEYALIIAFIALAVLLAIFFVQSRTSNVFSSVTGSPAAASASPGGSPSPSPTATPTPPPVCTVPNVLGTRRNDVQAAWTGVGFTTAVNFLPGTGNYRVGSQNPPAGVQGNCTTMGLTVGP